MPRTITTKGLFIMGKFVINKTKTGFTYSLKAGNGEIIAIGGEVYNTLASVKNGIESVKKNAPDAEVVEPEK